MHFISLSPTIVKSSSYDNYFDKTHVIEQNKSDYETPTILFYTAINYI